MFSESGEGGGPGYSAYIRETDGSPPVRLGEGIGVTPSRRTGNGSLSIVGARRRIVRAVLLPTGAGEPRPLPTQGSFLTNATWLPDGKRILV